MRDRHRPAGAQVRAEAGSPARAAPAGVAGRFLREQFPARFFGGWRGHRFRLGGGVCGSR